MLAHQVVAAERNRTAVFDDHVSRAVLHAQPLPQLVGVRNRRRQCDQLDAVGESEYHLLPDGSPVRIFEEVDLVEDHAPQRFEGPCAGIEHVAKYLGGHHDHRGIPPDGVVSSQQADIPRAQTAVEVPELLIGERLEGRGVEGAVSIGECPVDGMLGHDCLAAGGWRRHQHRAASVDCRHGPELEVIEFEGPAVHLAVSPGCGAVDGRAPVPRGSPARRTAASVPRG